jgi:hypothetical protein
VPKKKKACIEESETESYVGKPFGDLTQAELVAISETPRTRVNTVLSILDQVVASSKETCSTKRNAVAEDDKWWSGYSMPNMPKLMAETYHVGEYGTTIEQFARGTLKHRDKSKAAAHQTDHDTCQQYVNNLLGRPNTEEELDEKYNEFESIESQLAIREWHKHSDVHLQKEINLTMLTNEIQLRFTRTYASRSTPDTGKVRGKYDALVTVKFKDSRFYGKTIPYTPTNNWVEDNFTEESLAIVRRGNQPCI